jgi:hypothetical protein
VTTVPTLTVADVSDSLSTTGGSTFPITSEVDGADVVDVDDSLLDEHAAALRARRAASPVARTGRIRMGGSRDEARLGMDTGPGS